MKGVVPETKDYEYDRITRLFKKKEHVVEKERIKKGLPDPEDLKTSEDEKEKEAFLQEALEQEKDDIPDIDYAITNIPLAQFNANAVLNPRKAKLLNPSKVAMNNAFPLNNVKKAAKDIQKVKDVMAQAGTSVKEVVAEKAKAMGKSKEETKEDIMDELVKEIEELENEVESGEISEKKSDEATGASIDWGNSALGHLKESEKDEEERKKREAEEAKNVEKKDKSDGEVSDDRESGEVDSEEEAKRKKTKKRSSSKTKKRSRSRRRSYSRGRSPSRSRRRSYSRSRRSSYDRSSRRRSRSRSRRSPYSRSSYRRNRSPEYGFRRREGSYDRDRSRERRRRKEEERLEMLRRKAERHERSKLNKAKLLEIAKKNAAKILKSGDLLGMDQSRLIAMKTGGQSLDEITKFCREISKKGLENENKIDLLAESDSSSEEEFHHPFMVKDKPLPNPITMLIGEACLLECQLLPSVQARPVRRCPLLLEPWPSPSVCSSFPCLVETRTGARKAQVLASVPSSCYCQPPTSSLLLPPSFLPTPFYSFPSTCSFLSSYSLLLLPFCFILPFLLLLSFYFLIPFLLLPPSFPPTPSYSFPSTSSFLSSYSNLLFPLYFLLPFLQLPPAPSLLLPTSFPPTPSFSFPSTSSFLSSYSYPSTSRHASRPSWRLGAGS